MAVPATAYAETTGGTVKAWGNNNYGQLGNTSAGPTSSTPVTVSDLTKVKEIVAGGESAYALLTDSSTVKAWGNNRFGQLGDGTTEDSSTPVDVVDSDTGNALSGVKAIAAGGYMTYALLEDGTVKAWGSNYYGQLGVTGMSNTLTPVTVSDPNDPDGVLHNVVEIAASWDSGYARLSNGTVKAWGANGGGQLGNGEGGDESRDHDSSTPVDVQGLTGGNVTAIAAGWASAYALLEDGTVKAWGHNDKGQLGDGTTTNRSTPVTVSNLTNVKEIVAGHHSAYALLDNDGDGAVKAWGSNNTGELGDGSTTDRLTPVNVMVDPENGVKLTGVQQIAAGWGAGYALLNDGNDTVVKAWGWNNWGQLGDEATGGYKQPTPVTVSGFTTDVQAISARWNTAYAIVAPTDTTTTLSANPTSVTEGDSVTFTATVTPDADDKMEFFAGTVEFFNGTDSLGTATLSVDTDANTGEATLSTTDLPVGRASVTAKFTPAEPSAFNSSTSTSAATLTVAARTATTLSANQSSVTEGDEVALTATVAPAASGTVEFKYGDTTLDTVNVDANTGVATLATTELPVGINSVTAVFTPDDSTAFSSSTSDAVSVTVARATATTLTVDLSSVVEGDSVSFTATVEPKAAGTVEFFNGAINTDNLLGSADVDIETGQAEFSSTTLPAGTNSVTALFVPADRNSFSSSTSNTVSVTVARTTATTLIADQTSVTEGDELTLTATVAPAAAGTVEFFYGTTSLGTKATDANTGVATLATTALPVGTNSVTAVFTPADPTAFAPSTSDEVSVTVAARTTTTLDADQTSVTEGDTVTLTATVAPAAAGTVEFFNGTTSLGTAATDANTGVATLTTTELPVGTNSITAIFTPDDPTAFSSSTSDVVNVTVTAKETEPLSDDSDTSESDGETNFDTTLPETGDDDNPVEILGLISASLLAAGTALSIAHRRSVQ